MVRRKCASLGAGFGGVGEVVAHVFGVGDVAEEGPQEGLGGVFEPEREQAEPEGGEGVGVVPEGWGF